MAACRSCAAAIRLTAGHFETAGIDLPRGGLFAGTDTAGAPGAAVISHPLAGQLWPGEDPLGKQLRATWDFRGEDLTVVGVVEEARHWASEPGQQAQLYVPWRRGPEHAGDMMAVVRSPLPGAVAGCAAAAALSRLMSGLLYGVEPMDATTLAATPTLLLAVAVFASWVPARRSTRIDPVHTLRAE